MNCSYKKIFVAAPGETVSGGPELLHQLVHELRSLGIEAYISYLPGTQAFKKPTAYTAYDAVPAGIEDEAGNLVIFPETLVGEALAIRRAQCAIWWLSVDYYLPRLHKNLLQDLMLMVLFRLRGQRPWRISSLRGMLHFTQSAYAYSFLQDRGLPSRMLTDYLSADHVSSNDSRPRRNRVLYNPRKGFQTTALLMKANPDIEFMPLQGMTPAGVAQVLQESKLYIDFGFHPGKDRMPREAALAGCCVLVGRRGSAAYDADVDIPSPYKFDERRRDFLSLFRSTVLSVFAEFDRHTREFDAYRDTIRNEYEVFRAQVREIFLPTESQGDARSD